MPSPSVLVVGAGPAGLIAALTLLKNGISVRIIEKDAVWHRGERGPGVMPRTLEIEHFLGVEEEVKRTATPPPLWFVYDPNNPQRVLKTVPFAEVLEETPAFPEGRSMTIGQWKHQAILRKHIEALGGAVELGSTLLSVKQNEEDDYATADISITVDGKQVIETAQFAYIIGADGGHSAVRKSLGLAFVGETREEGRMFIADCIIEGIEGQGGFHLWGDVKTTFASIRDTGTPGCFQMILSGKIDYDALKANPTIETLQLIFNRGTGRTDLVIKEVINWQGEWRANIRMAEKFRVGRVFVIGDAGHTHSPTGGQGLNSSMQDAFNLCWKLALAVRGLATPTLLDSFEVERMPVIADMLKITTDLYKVIYDPETRRKLELAKKAETEAADAYSEARERGWFRGRKLFQLDLNYRWSTVVLDERYADAELSEKDAYGVPGRDLRAGDRAPDAPALLALPFKGNGELTRLFDIFKPSFHTILLFSSGNLEDIKPFVSALAGLPSDLFKILALMPSGAAVQGALDGIDLTLEDTKGHARDGYGLKDNTIPTAVLVRPDGMIGAFAISAKGVEKYLSTIFVRA